jgi:hypothetical protein
MEVRMMRGWQYNAAVAFLSVATLIGCSDGGDGDVGNAESGSILISPSIIAFQQVALGTSADLPVTIRNTSSDPLTVFEVRLEPRAGASIDDLSVQNLKSTPIKIAGNSAETFQLRYAPTTTARARGTLVFKSSDPKRVEVRVDVETLENRPALEVTPGQVRFTRLPPGQRAEQVVVLRNFGSSPLTIFDAPSYAGGADFTLVAPARTYPLNLEPFNSEQAALDPVKYELRLTTRYSPIGNGADTGELRIVSNDLSDAPAGATQGTRTVSVGANAEAPCILVDSTVRNLGQVPVGRVTANVVTVQNCGRQKLSISAIDIAENTADLEFELDLGGRDGNMDGVLDQSIELDPEAQTTFIIKYTPAQEGTDRATLRINSNDPVQPALDISVVARGANGVCPVAKAGGRIRGVSSGLRNTISAIPLQYIVLDGSASTDEDGVIPNTEEGYSWEIVKAPAGFAGRLVPTREDASNMDWSRRELRLLLAGEYIIRLKTRDNTGFESCNEDEVRIVAIPNEKILVELTWTNPTDPDETDEDGSDVDLHMTKMGPGRWFEAPYDVYFRNSNSGPGSDNNRLWNPESPSLDIDDINGAGPENIQMNDPAPCQWYAVGVHYYKQVYGTAYATVRIYINGNVVYEKLNQPLTRNGQFWDVARIHWDSGLVYDVDQLLPAAPNGQLPAVNGEMSASGLCTEAQLY